MSDRFERVLSTILVGAAALIAVGMVHREFFTPVPTSAGNAQLTTRFEKDWRDYLLTDRVFGDTAAPVKIVEFTDLECPFCKDFHRNVRQLLSAYPRDVAVYFIHFPSVGHRFALPAARAAECARAQGRFAEFVDIVFTKQDSLGLIGWGALASEAGVRDTASIAGCAIQNREVPAIAGDIAKGRRLNVTGTPTVLYNGWRVEGTATLDELSRIVQRVKAGKQPFAKPGSQGD